MDYSDYEGDTPEEKITAYFFDEMCKALGAALCYWQYVERAHFRLFLKMLEAPNWETCSAAYYSVESFEARHRMVGRVARYFLKGNQFGSHRETWCGLGGGLEKEIKTANENRNKIAHYELDFDILDNMRRRSEIEGAPPLNVQWRIPKFKPAADNMVGHLIGRLRSDPKHVLTIGTITKYADQFYELAQKIDQFEGSFTLPPLHERDRAPDSGHPNHRRSRQRRSPKKSRATAERPSG